MAENITFEVKPENIYKRLFYNSQFRTWSGILPCLTYLLTYLLRYFYLTSTVLTLTFEKSNLCVIQFSSKAYQDACRKNSV